MRAVHSYGIHSCVYIVHTDDDHCEYSQRSAGLANGGKIKTTKQ